MSAIETSRESKQEKARENNLQNQVTAILDAGASFEGRLSFEGTVQIGGVFKGEILLKTQLS